ncbi:M20/M25/M40 family metallo-hydrolase [Sporosarcina sp. JAI121]|uniref:M20/M25/M40 family metallo-hydrolase n=1 Tax=Sporosarcina sp. JAI121 TaxID=2723064 RepID=UPI0015CC98F1|nr:M20/M25/M40 family metallo-hydrolase [Sporosarcina sp. JAI121]NYF25487.1 aminopeptidase YwaD [Sporosarcina sp. JAI121]
MARQKMLFSFLLLCSILLTACSPKTQVVESAEFTQVQTEFIQDVDFENIFASLETLTKEPRVAGTKAELQAAAFVAAQLKMSGYVVDVQPFDFERYVMPESHRLVVEGFDSPLSPAPFQFSVDGNTIGELVDAGHGLKADYKKLDVADKIVLVEVADTPFKELVLSASDAGAQAIILYFPDGLEVNKWSLGREGFEEFIPALALTYEEGTNLLDFIKSGKSANAAVSIKGARIETAASQNLIATKSPVSETDDDIVIIGAHYDSVDKAPGASDNASGTAVVLELARMFKAIPTNKEIRFLFFGAEEEGLYGSEKYVSALTKDEIKRSVAMFNLDMVGSAHAGELSIQTIDGSDNTVTKVASKANKILNGDSIKTEVGDRSDHTPFHKAGIDAALFIYNPVEEWYHTPEDTVNKLSKDRLLNVAKIVGSSVFDLTFSGVSED